MNLTIEVFGGPMDGKKFILSTFPVSLGRSSDNDGEFQFDEFISKRHCTIFEDKGELYVADLKSRNGTYLNNKLIKNAEILNDGDILTIGRTNIKCSIQPSK